MYRFVVVYRSFDLCAHQLFDQYAYQSLVLLYVRRLFVQSLYLNGYIAGTIRCSCTRDSFGSTDCECMSSRVEGGETRLRSIC